MSIPVIDTLNPLGDFPVVNSSDVDVNGKRLDTVLESKVNKSEISEIATGKADKTYVDEQLANKADSSSVSGKAEKSYVDSELEKKADRNALAGKVDKVDGKGLSENDYSNSERDKVTAANEAATTLNLMFRLVD